jgi:hypothetical protein
MGHLLGERVTDTIIIMVHYEHVITQQLISDMESPIRA